MNNMVESLKKAFNPNLTQYIVVYLKNSTEPGSDFEDFLFNKIRLEILDMICAKVERPIIFNYLLMSVQVLKTGYDYSIMDNKQKIEKVLALIYDPMDSALLNQLISYCVL